MADNDIYDVAAWAQAVLTALNVHDVRRESLLHRKLREVMIAHRDRREALAEIEDEQAILLPTGAALCVRYGTIGGVEVKIRDPQGNEILHWESSEWAEDPETVMGAIFGAAACPLDKLLKNRVLEDGIWNYRSPQERGDATE